MTRRFAAAPFLILAMCVTVEAKPPGTQYGKFLEMTPEAREKMVRRYVRKDGEFWLVTKGIYTVRCTVSAEKALEDALFMEGFGKRMDRIFTLRPKAQFRPVVYHLKTRDAMIAVINSHLAERGGGSVPDWVDGLFISNLQGLYVYESRHANSTLLHEGTHQFLSYTLGLNYRHLPVWFDEGFATNFETWDLSEDGRTNLEKCRERSTRRFVIKAMFDEEKLPFTLSRLLKRDRETWAGAKGKETHYQYAMAWSFADYLLNTREGTAYAKKVLKRAYSGKPPAKVVRKLVEYYGGKWETYVKEKMLPLVPEGTTVKFD